MDGEGTTRHAQLREWRLTDPAAAIEELAAGQHGVVTRRQLLRLGLGREAIDGLLRHRRLNRLHRGVYLVGPTAPRLAYHQAALLYCGAAATLGHAGAAQLHQMLPHPAERTPVAVIMARGHASKDPLIDSHRVRLHRREWWIRHGLRVTTPQRTIIDLAASSPAVVGPALREGMVRNLLDLESLRREVERRPGRRGSARLRTLIDAGLATATRSDPERELLGLLRRARLPEPETNARLGRWEVDLLWREQRLAVEVDAYATHSSPSAFEADRARDAELRRLGFTVCRFTARQIAREPEATLASIATELGR